MPYAHWRNHVNFAHVYMTRWDATVLYLALGIAERKRSCCKKRSSCLAERSISATAAKLHLSRENHGRKARRRPRIRQHIEREIQQNSFQETRET